MKILMVTFITLRAPIQHRSVLLFSFEVTLTNGVDPDQTAPGGAV